MELTHKNVGELAYTLTGNALHWFTLPCSKELVTSVLGGLEPLLMLPSNCLCVAGGAAVHIGMHALNLVPPAATAPQCSDVDIFVFADGVKAVLDFVRGSTDEWLEMRARSRVGIVDLVRAAPRLPWQLIWSCLGKTADQLVNEFDWSYASAAVRMNPSTGEVELGVTPLCLRAWVTTCTVPLQEARSVSAARYAKACARGFHVDSRETYHIHTVEAPKTHETVVIDVRRCAEWHVQLYQTVKTGCLWSLHPDFTYVMYEGDPRFDSADRFVDVTQTPCLAPIWGFVQQQLEALRVTA